jgi:hypothetical protein
VTRKVPIGPPDFGTSSQQQKFCDAGSKVKTETTRQSFVNKWSAVTRPLHKIRLSKFGSRESLANSRESLAYIPGEATLSRPKPSIMSCKIHLDGHKDVITYKGNPDVTIRTGLTEFLRSQGIKHSSMDVYHLNSDKPMSVEVPMANLNEKEILVESRALFRLDLPGQSKSLGIKARPDKLFLDILKPLLTRYNIASSLEMVQLVIEAKETALMAKDLEGSTAADFDSDRITIVNLAMEGEFHRQADKVKQII